MAFNWTLERQAVLRNLCERGFTNSECADLLGTTSGSIKDAKYRYGIESGEALPPEPLESLKDVLEGEVRQVTSESTTIKTVEDLLDHIEVDMSAFDVVSSEATKWDSLVKGPTGLPVVTEMFRVAVKLKPKTGIDTRAAIDAMVIAAMSKCTPPKRKAIKIYNETAPWNVIPIFDPHFGKYAWGRSTGHKDYDLNIAQELIENASVELIDASNDIHGPTRRTIILGGDIFHYDTPGGTTTAGTPLDRDGRMQKMIEMATETIINVIDYSAEACHTDVVLVDGNHDTAMSWALQRILIERFRNDERVSVDQGYTSRKYLTYGKNLIGVTHGDKARKRLPQIMALEVPKLWGDSTYREIHIGHLHHQLAEKQAVTDTVDGVIVRMAPAMCPPDDWHAAKGFLGALQAMESFHYVPEGGLLELRVSTAK
jgi:hypothetical protein